MRKRWLYTAIEALSGYSSVRGYGWASHRRPTDTMGGRLRRECDSIVDTAQLLQILA
jgi:hypothetical protein